MALRRPRDIERAAHLGARARVLAADVNDPDELAPIHAGLFNASLTHGELAPMREVADAIMRAAEAWPKSSIAAVVANWTSGLTCWFEGNYLSARGHFEQALAIYRAEPNPAIFRALTTRLTGGAVEVPCTRALASRRDR